ARTADAGLARRLFLQAAAQAVEVSRTGGPRGCGLHAPQLVAAQAARAVPAYTRIAKLADGTGDALAAAAAAAIAALHAHHTLGLQRERLLAHVAAIAVPAALGLHPVELVLAGVRRQRVHPGGAALTGGQRRCTGARLGGSGP